MTRIVNNLHIGTIQDIPLAESLNYSILGCCKDPLHRQHARLQGASEEGYVTKAMPKDEPEYLWAERDHALYLNLIDAKDPKYIPDEVINKALGFIDKEISDGRNVLICCNKCESRSPSIAFMWLIKSNCYPDKLDFDYTLEAFKSYIYRNYNPSVGMKQYVKKFWEEYCNGQ